MLNISPCFLSGRIWRNRGPICSGQKWKVLKKVGARDILEGRESIMREVTRIIKLRRLPTPTAALVNVLTKLRGVCTRDERSKTFDKVNERVYWRLCVQLPRTLSIPYPASPKWYHLKYHPPIPPTSLHPLIPFGLRPLRGQRRYGANKHFMCVKVQTNARGRG